MGDDDILTDDYVAEMLAKEANNCSLKYSSLGLEAYRESKLAHPCLIFSSLGNRRLTTVFQTGQQGEAEYTIPSTHHQGD